MTTSRVMAVIPYGARQVAVRVADKVASKGFIRPIDIIDKKEMEKAIETTKAAFLGNVMLTHEQKEKTTALMITSMPHPSRSDPYEHSTMTVVAMDEIMATAHANTDQSKQKPAVVHEK